MGPSAWLPAGECPGAADGIHGIPFHGQWHLSAKREHWGSGGHTPVTPWGCSQVRDGTLQYEQML